MLMRNLLLFFIILVSVILLEGHANEVTVIFWDGEKSIVKNKAVTTTGCVFGL